MLDDKTANTPALVLTISSLAILLLAGQKFSSFFQYDRSAIIGGEYWRILTCHFVHTGWKHMLLNMIGAIIILRLFVRLYSPFSWLRGALCCMVGIGISFLIFCPTLEWYMGLSGLLHGLLLMGIVGEIKNGNRFYYFGLAAILGKLAMEYVIGPLDSTSRFINIPIITSAHLAGAITGSMTACLIAFTQKQSGRFTAGAA